MCTFEECEESDEVFDTQKAFIKHEIEKHRSVQSWKCPCGSCSKKYLDKDSLSDHVTLNHWKNLNGKARAQHAFELEADPAIENVQCPFCQAKIKPGGRRTLARHLGQHMEKISFAAVTKPYAGWKFYDETSSEGSHDYGNKGPLAPEWVSDSDKRTLMTELTVTMDRITVLDPADPSSHKHLAWEHASMKERLSNIDIDEPYALEKMKACHTILQIIIQKFKEYLELPHRDENSNMSIGTGGTHGKDRAG